MNIEIISGSPRKTSKTRRAAVFLQDWLKANTTHVVGVIDMQDWNLPPVITTFTSVETTPEEYRPLSERIFNADAFILVTPEYNGSYSPTMKNMLDHFPKQLHKAMGIVTASPGSLGGMRAAQQLLLLAPAMFAIPSPFLLVIPQIDKKFNEDGSLADQAFYTQAHTFLAEFLWLAERLASDKN
ncbi:MAG: NADPH-dependent oxidoreductase [Chitinophagaceae bacterium]|nr:MAG: NADPH-dependent oxidoreductase [Chitinophagaceae bacterium]